MKTKLIAILLLFVVAGCASVSDYVQANPAAERSGSIVIWKGLGVELTLWEYKFKGKPASQEGNK
jgi:hypothetical protein